MAYRRLHQKVGCNAGPPRPVNMTKLQEGLQLLRDNPNVRQINAELKPGTAPR